MEENIKKEIIDLYKSKGLEVNISSDGEIMITDKDDIETVVLSFVTLG